MYMVSRKRAKTIRYKSFIQFLVAIFKFIGFEINIFVFSIGGNILFRHVV